MSSNNQAQIETSSSTNEQIDKNDCLTTNQLLPQGSTTINEEIQEVDAAAADQSDSWETDDEGDFYTEQINNHESDEDDDSFFSSGLSKHLIGCYPITTAEEISVVGALCDICLNEYRSHDKIRTIPCLHRFHTRCIDKWLKKSSKCPMCRSDLRKSKWYSS